MMKEEIYIVTLRPLGEREKYQVRFKTRLEAKEYVADCLAKEVFPITNENTDLIFPLHTIGKVRIDKVEVD